MIFLALICCLVVFAVVRVDILSEFFFFVCVFVNEFDLGMI